HGEQTRGGRARSRPPGAGGANRGRPTSRSTKKPTRLYGVLNNRLADGPWLAGNEYTIADMICYPWTVNYKGQGQDIEEFKYVKRWAEAIAKRPGVQKGMAVGANLSTDVTKLPPEEQARIRKLLYNQRAIPVA